MKPTQLKLKTEYRDKLEALRQHHNRPSLANMNEVLIDEAYKKIKKAVV